MCKIATRKYECINSYINNISKCELDIENKDGHEFYRVLKLLSR